MKIINLDGSVVLDCLKEQLEIIPICFVSSTQKGGGGGNLPAMHFTYCSGFSNPYHSKKICFAMKWNEKPKLFVG